MLYQIFILSLSMFVVFSIKCLQCTSLVDRACYSGNVSARQCDSSVDHCIKYVGVLSPPLGMSTS